MPLYHYAHGYLKDCVALPTRRAFESPIALLDQGQAVSQGWKNERTIGRVIKAMLMKLEIAGNSQYVSIPRVQLLVKA